MPSRQPDLTLTMDGRELRAHSGDSILQVAREAGIPVPTLCYVEGLSVWGGCRLCVVEVGDEHRLQPACGTAVADELEVRTDSDRLRTYRRDIVELLFAEGNHVCAVCVANGNCELQDLAVELDIDHVDAAYQFPARRVDATHPRYIFDPDRCILCTRCVRTCAEIEGAHVWSVASRGNQAHLVTEMGQPWGDAPSCTSCGKCVAVCPTGALHDRGTAIGEAVSDLDLVTFLKAARDDDEWYERKAMR